MATNTGWVVTTSGERPIEAVVADLKQQGFAVEQTLSEIGCITGKASAGVAGKLRQVAGVADVAPEFGIDIGPPDAPVS
jgi:hypothetical protein